MSAREFVIAHNNVSTLWEPAKLRFVPRGPKRLRPLIERAIRFLLRWSGAEIGREETVRTFHVAVGQTLLERMRLQQRDMLRLYNREARTVYVGPDVLTELHREMASMSLHYHNFQMMGDRGLRVLGVEVVYVPWMDGVILVPHGAAQPRAERETTGG